MDETLQFHKFEGAYFKYGNSFFKITVQKYSNKAFLVSNLKFFLFFNETRKTITTFNNKFLIILKTYVHYYVIDLSTEHKNVRKGVHIFTKIKNTDG